MDDCVYFKYGAIINFRKFKSSKKLVAEAVIYEKISEKGEVNEKGKKMYVLNSRFLRVLKQKILMNYQVDTLTKKL